MFISNSADDSQDDCQRSSKIAADRPRSLRSGGDRESFRGNSLKKIDFVHVSDVSARSGSRELRAIKIPASYDAWRPPKRRKNDSEKIRFFEVLEISFQHLG